MTFNILLTIIYFASLIVSYGISLAINWEDVHTVFDFLFPWNEYMASIALIYFPISNTLFALGMILYGISIAIHNLLNITIKK